MHLRPIGLSLVALLLTAFGLISVPAARATPAVPTAPHHALRPASLLKTTLADTSIGGPAVDSRSGTSPASGIRSVLGWAGTDAAHHLNVMVSTDGIHFGDKRTLDETSFARPAVAVVGNGAVAVAWTGVDSNHSLNILYDVYGAIPRKVTLTNEDSFTAPALGVASAPNGPLRLVLGWTGTDPNQSLNLRLFTIPGLVPVNKTIAPASFNSIAGPTFAPNERVLNERALFMTWAARTPLQRVAYTPLSWNGTQWIGLDSPVFVDDELSASNPGFLAAASLQDAIVAWTGIDPDHKLNYITGLFGTAERQKTTLTFETALGGPALGATDRANEWILAWTGTDAQHHLNIAIPTPQGR